MPIQWEPGTVYIPSDAVLNLRERTVSLPDPSGNGTVVIGHMNSESSMIPTNAFRTRFPDQWALCTQENGGGQKSAGMFALLLGISRKTGLYEALSRSFGVEVCNTVLDAAASLLRGAVSPADPEMSGQVLLSEQRRDADWYNTFLTRNWDRGRNSFRDKWMDACRNRLGPDCLVCADPEGPSREGEDPAAYVRVVDAGTGIPLVMFCGNPDSALEEALKVVDARNLNLRAVLLGPYLGTQERLDWLRHRGCDYALRLPPDSDIFQTLHREFSDRIRCDITSCIGPDSRISGIQQMRML